MNDTGEMRDDIKLPEDPLGKEITERHEKEEQFMVTVLSSMNEEAVVATKNMTSKW